MKPKILYVQHSGNMGGAPRSLGFLLERLDRTRFDASVVVARPGPAVDHLRATGLPVAVNSKLSPFHGSTVSGMSLRLFLRNVLLAGPTYREACRVLAQEKPDILHLNATCLFLVAKACKRVSPSTKILVHVREPLLDSWAGWILKFMNHRYADAFVSIDQYDASKIDATGRISEVVYNFVHFPQHLAETKSSFLRDQLGLASSDIVLLYLARISPSNGALLLLTYLQNYLKTHPHVHLVMAGFPQAPNDTYTKKVLTLGQTLDRVHMLQFRDDVAELVSSSDILICPFTVPHFSRAIIEAAMLGTPSLGSDLGGPQELILHGETGYLFPPKEQSTFLLFLDELVQNPDLRKRMGQKAAEHAAIRFSAEKNATKIFGIYERLLDGNGDHE